MRDDQLRAKLATLEAARSVVAKHWEHARANLEQWAGIGTGGGGGGGGSDHSDPTAAAAVLEKAARDKFAHLHTSLGFHVEEAKKHLVEAEKIVRAATNRALPRGADGCSVCGLAKYRGYPHECGPECRQRDHEHTEAWQPVYTRRVPPQADKGDTKKVPYCSFCAEFIERYGVEPAMRITLEHLDHPGQQIKFALIREEHPTEFERYHGRGRRRSA